MNALASYPAGVRIDPDAASFFLAVVAVALIMFVGLMVRR